MGLRIGLENINKEDEVAEVGDAAVTSVKGQQEKNMNTEKPEPILLGKVRLNFGYFGAAALVYGLFFTFCLYRNWIGILIPVLVAGSFITAVLLFGRLGIRIKRESYFCAAAGTLLGVSTCLTANNIIQFFNYVGFFLLFCIFILHQVNEDIDWGIGIYLKAICLFVLKSIGCLGYPFAHCYWYLKESNEGKYKRLIGILSGLVLAVPVLAVLVRLLMDADMVFQRMVTKLVYNIALPERFLGILFLFLFGTLMMYAFLCCICLEHKVPEQKTVARDATAVLTVTILTSAVYLMFSMIQAVYLFTGLGTLPSGMTYAEYARQGFFQLLFVAFFNLVLVLMCLSRYRENKKLRMVLTVISGCTFVMIISAVYRMCLYVQVYHLTFLRVLVLWFLGLLTVLMGGVTVYIYKSKFPLFRYFLLLVSCFYIVLSFAKPDRIIARYNLSHWNDAATRDVYYMTHQLSADAAEEVYQLKGMKDININQSAPYYWIKEYFEEIEENYQKESWRQYHFAYERAMKFVKQP